MQGVHTILVEADQPEKNNKFAVTADAITKFVQWVTENQDKKVTSHSFLVTENEIKLFVQVFITYTTD